MTTTSRSKCRGQKYGYRSGLEEKIGLELKALGIPVRYEEIKISYVKPAKSSTYTPDFLFWKKAECPICAGLGEVTSEDGLIVVCDHCDGMGRDKLFVETKGRFVTADRLKHIEIKKQHPHLDIRFVFSNSRQRISKTSKTTYASWCEKHGFKYADKSVPKSWLEEVISAP